MATAVLTMEERTAQLSRRGRKRKTEFSEADSIRLCQAYRDSRKDMRFHREERQEAIRQCVGRHWSQDGARDITTVPMMALGLETYVMLLAANAPRVMCSAERRELKPYASDLEHAVNKWVAMREGTDNDLANEFQLAALDGLLLSAMMKVGLKEAGYVDIEGQTILVGEPFAETIDYEDCVVDMAAARKRDREFIGNRYRLPLEDVQDSPLYERSVADTLRPMSMSDYWEDGDEKTERMSRESANDRQTFLDYVNLWDFYLPRRGLIVTFPDPDDQQEWRKPLRVAQTTRNPYHELGFFGVPNNHTPLPPVAHWRDLHALANMLMNKSMRQAQRQKNIGLVGGGSGSDAERITNAKDGEWIRVDNPQGSGEVSFGGPDQRVIGAAIAAKDMLSYVAGNIDLLAGLSPQSGTLGQDELLSRSASKRINFMQQKMARFAGGVMRDVARFLFTDPLVKIRIIKPVKGYPALASEGDYTFESQKGDFLDYEIKVDLHSMPLQTPSGKAQMLMQVIQGMALPLAPLMAQQGQALDVRALLKKVGRLLNIEDELSDIIVDSQPPDSSERGAGAHERTLPAGTQRTYERVNRPGATQGQKDQAAMTMFMGGNGNVQKSERAAMYRPVG